MKSLTLRENVCAAPDAENFLRRAHARQRQHSASRERSALPLRPAVGAFSKLDNYEHRATKIRPVGFLRRRLRHFFETDKKQTSCDVPTKNKKVFSATRARHQKCKPAGSCRKQEKSNKKPPACASARRELRDPSLFQNAIFFQKSASTFLNALALYSSAT